MSNILQADIFFFVSTISVVLVTIVILLIGYRVLKILRKAERVVRYVGFNAKRAGNIIKRIIYALR